MSSNSDFINDTCDSGWTTVRSHKLIKKCINENTNSVNESKSTSPTNEMISASPTNETNSASPVNETNSASTNETNSSPPIINPSIPPVNTFGFKNNFPIVGDWWQSYFEFLKVQKNIIENNLQYLSKELLLPPWLRGKTLEDKNNLINNSLYILIGKMLIGIKNEIVMKNKWVDTINPNKITGMIIEKHDLTEKIAIFYNSIELTNKIKESCELLFEDFYKNEKKFSTNEKKSSTNETKSETSKEIIIQSKTDKKFSYDERVEHKQALIAAQEKFFEACVLSEKDVISFKENINSFTSWTGTVNTINLSNDEIKIGKYSFSKKHFLENSWFKERLMEKYCNLFTFKTAKLIITKNVLIIQGTV